MNTATVLCSFLVCLHLITVHSSPSDWKCGVCMTAVNAMKNDKKALYVGDLREKLDASCDNLPWYFLVQPTDCKRQFQYLITPLHEMIFGTELWALECCEAINICTSD